MKANIYSPALYYLRKYKNAAFWNVIFNLLTTFFAILSFIVLKPFLDILFLPPQATSSTNNSTADGLIAYFTQLLNGYVVENGRYSGLVLVCGLILICFFFKNLFRYLALLIMSPVRNGIERDIRQNLFDKIQLLPLSFFSQERKGDLLSRFGADVQEIQWGVLRSLESIVRSPVAILGSLGVMIYISASLTLFSFVLMIGVGLIIGRIGKKLKSAAHDSQHTLGYLLAIVEETLGGLRIIKSFQVERYQSGVFAQHNEHYYQTQLKINRRKELSSPLTEFLGIGIVAVLLLFGGSLVFEGYFEPSTFVVFVMMFYNIIEPAKSLSAAYYDIQKAKAAMERINAIMSIPNTEKSLPAGDNPHATAKIERVEISYHNVSFSYNDSQKVLTDINLHIPHAQLWAIVGGSGGGKSTLVDLLPKFYPPTAGFVSINGVDIAQMELHALRRLIAIVSQEAILFNDTIYNNIALGAAQATEEEVIAAAKLANAHDFILKTPQAYQTNIGDRGANLSGGQKQRLTLARAILKNAPILILDEATSALDSESEQLIYETLQILRQTKTILLIAHKFNHIHTADNIVVMQQGQIAEMGTHQALLDKGGAYAKLYHLQ